MKSLRLAVCALPAFALAGCVAGTEPGDEATSTTTSEVINCPAWGCGENSPVMGPYRFHELNLQGLPNDQQVQVLNFQKGATVYRPVIAGAKLSAIDIVTNTTIAGAALTDGWFNLQTPTGVFKLYITRVSPASIPYWVGNTTERNETYELQYDVPGIHKPTELCNSAPPYEDLSAGHTWINPYEALLFTGDRYDARLKTVTASTYSTTAGWLNIACAGSAVAKLHLNRHTTAGSPGPGLVTTTALQRQAMLKMFVSDICGTGMAFTTKGTPLHWDNLGGWGNVTGLEFDHEAMWSSTGAMCLDTHRLGSSYLAEIHALCSRPACPAGWPRSAYLTSAVPLPVL